MATPSPSQSADASKPSLTRPLERPAADHSVFRSQLHAAGRNRPRDHGSAELCGQADGAGGPGRGRFAGQHAIGESGLHLRPGAAEESLAGFQSGAGGGFEEGSTGTTEGTAETGGSFTVDDTEYNIFNTDRRLEALRSIADKLAHIEQKKSLIYFSSGMDRTGIENQSELRSATNAAVRANMAIYTMDIRGLQALVPGGEAQNASLRGTSPYSGKSRATQFDSNATTQETLVTLAGDTGGRAFLDSNDFGQVFTGVQQDTSMYYLLGYHSTNPARDGRFRRITVRVNRPGAQNRLPARLLRSRRLPALHPRRPRTPARRRACLRSSDHRSAGLSVRRILPHRGQQILCARLAGRARLADPFHSQ